MLAAPEATAPAPAASPSADKPRKKRAKSDLPSIYTVFAADIAMALKPKIQAVIDEDFNGIENITSLSAFASKFSSRYGVVVSTQKFRQILKAAGYKVNVPRSLTLEAPAA